MYVKEIVRWDTSPNGNHSLWVECPRSGVCFGSISMWGRRKGCVAELQHTLFRDI